MPTRITLMPKLVFDLREGEQISNTSLREACDYQIMN
jgi:hypothetical protein